jgi:hypothetical protein
VQEVRGLGAQRGVAVYDRAGKRIPRRR